MNHRNRLHLALLFLLVMVPGVLQSCSPDPPASGIVDGLPQGRLWIGADPGLQLNVDLALTPTSQAQGLMGVEEIPLDYGMVFMWATPGRHSFHMLNTLIPLDIAFWDEQMVIVDIQTMQPCRQDECPVYTPAADHIAAVEVRAGLLESAGVRVGDRVRLESSL